MSTDDRYPHNAEDWRLYDVPDDYFFTWIIGYNIHWMMDLLVLSEHSSNDVNPSDYRMIHRIQSYNPEHIASRKHIQYGCISTGSGSNERQINVGQDTKEQR
eukprot:454117_1